VSAKKFFLPKTAASLVPLRRRFFLMEDIRNRSAVVLLGVLALTSCYDQIVVPEVQTDGRLTVTNDEAALGARLSYPETEVPIDPASPSAFGRAAAPPTPSTVTLTLKAELDPPVVDGRVVQATSVSARRRFTFLISYNTAGDPFVGAIDYVINPFGLSPRLVSSVAFNDSDVSAVGLDDDWIYAAQATGASDRPTPATLERLSLASSGILLENNDRLDLTSFAATSVLTVGGVVYVTTGDGGHLYALNASDMSTLGQFALDDARWVAHDAENGRIVVVQGTPGRISVFREGDFSGGSISEPEIFPFPGANVPESKSTVEVVGGKAFIAAGPEGVQVMCLDDGTIVGSVPRPDPAALGMDPSVVVTNAVTVDEDLMFISNGEAGVYVAAGAADFASTPCDAPQDITVLGHLRFDDLESVNHVDYENKRLVVAAGLGGVKIVQIKIH
jgi:outer membrane protein assembly factor BamB